MSKVGPQVGREWKYKGKICMYNFFRNLSNVVVGDTIGWIVFKSMYA